MAKIFTEEGLKKLQTELEERKTKIRHEIAEAIKEAKEQGDLSENAEYTEAKHHQNENESRIAELEGMLKDSVVAAKHKGAKNSISKLSVPMKLIQQQGRFPTNHLWAKLFSGRVRAKR